MNLKKLFVMGVLALSNAASASSVSEFTLPFGKVITTDGSTTINLDVSVERNITVSKTFYGADTHGFSTLPDPSLVAPLQLGFVKFGGSLHSTYNFELNAYYDDGIFYVYSPLERRIKLVQQAYKASPMFQINMLGWQPDVGSANGEIVYTDTANAKKAAAAITYLNGTKKLNVENIIMGNEPFESMEVHQKDIPSADEYIAKYIKYAMAVREAEEKASGNANGIKLWGPEIASGWTGWQTTHPDDCDQQMRCSYGNGEFTEFMPYFLSRLAKFEKDSANNPKKYKMLDVLTWHYYPLFRKNFSDRASIILSNDGTQNVAGMLESVNLWDSKTYINKYDYASPRGIAPNLINKFQDWRNTYYPNAKLAVTEFAVDSVGNIGYHPIVRPLYLADLMAKLASGGVDTFVNSFLQSGEVASSWAMINGQEKSNMYNVYSLFSNYFKGNVLTATDSFGDKVNSYSVKSGMATNVFFVNKDKVAHSTSLNFKKDGNVEEITSLSLPAWSITVLTITEGQTQSIKVRQYGAREMGISIE